MLRIYLSFDAWFDAVSDIDPEAVAAPYRLTLGEAGLVAAGCDVADALAWVRVHARGVAHYLEPYPTPDMEHSIVFEDLLDATAFRRAWGRFDVDAGTTLDRRMIAHGAAMMRRLRGGPTRDRAK
jgi:hypothetical protein